MIHPKTPRRRIQFCGGVYGGRGAATCDSSLDLPYVIYTFILQFFPEFTYFRNESRTLANHTRQIVLHITWGCAPPCA